MANKLSVIVHTEKEASALSRCLSALVAQRLSTRELEIIVVDSRKRLAVRQLVTWWNHTLAARASTTRVNYIAPRQGALADTFVYRICSGDIVAQIEETAAPDANWAARGVASVLERESASTRTIFTQYESFSRKHDLLLLEQQQVSSQVAVSSSPNFSSTPAAIAPPPIRLAADVQPAERRRFPLPPLRYYVGAFLVLVAVGAALSQQAPLALTAAAGALVGLLVLMLVSAIDVSQRPNPRQVTSTTDDGASGVTTLFRRKSV